MPIDYDPAWGLLEKLYTEAQDDFLSGTAQLSLGEELRAASANVFWSKTQSYREVLLGCSVARYLDRKLNVRKPYIDLGADAFSGRTLDERVINSFLQDKQIPASKGPYLAVFRRQVQFDDSSRAKMRDTAGYDALMICMSYLERLKSKKELDLYVRYLLTKFIELREAANIPLRRIQRFSLDQYDRLLTRVLATASGGRFPVLFTVAVYQTLRRHFHLQWDIQFQGINVADAASGSGADITISHASKVVLAVEVTERTVNKARVVSTFNTKISPAQIEDYLFITKSASPDSEAKQQADQYFAQGHEINFLEVKNWIVTVLATLGKGGRTIFNEELMILLDSPDVPRIVKVSWNEKLSNLLS
jgi:hypothetical protein